MKKIIAPSLLSCDFSNLQSELEMLNKSEATWFHLDIMDGVFVPNITFGMPVIRAIKKHAKKPLDVHLMIVQPERYITDFKNAGADILTVHYEACTHLHRIVQEIKKEGMKAGISINPHTPISVLSDIITEVDLVLIMSVNPGFGGQTFIENSFKKIHELKKLIQQSNSKAIIEIDGGISADNIENLSKAGVDVFVAGNAIFNSDNPIGMIKNLNSIVTTES